MNRESWKFNCLFFYYCRFQIYEPLVQLRLYSSETENQHSDTAERIYEGVLHNKIRLVKMFSLVTSAGSIMCQPYLISKAAEMDTSSTAIGGIMFTFGFFAFVTPIMLHIITRRYVVSVDYNHDKDTYVATTYSLFATKKQVSFQDLRTRLLSLLFGSRLCKKSKHYRTTAR